MDLTGWIEYFSEGLATQSQEIQERLREGVTRRTLQRELKELVKIGAPVAEGATNRLRYRLGKSA